MSSAELPSTAASSSTTVSIDETLYRTVLARWKRCHAEGALLAAELRRVEANRRAETLFRLLTIQQSNALQSCMRRWALQVSLLRELELEERCRALEERERATRAAEDLALAHLNGGGVGFNNHSSSSNAVVPLPPPPPPPAALVPAELPPLAPQGLGMGLGSRANQLLSAWRRENAVA